MRKDIVVVDCDMCGAPGRDVPETTFDIDGVTFELDLCAACVSAFAATIRPFTGASRRETDSGSEPGPVVPIDRQAVRVWAAARGFDVKKGRLPDEAIAAYRESTLRRASRPVGAPNGLRSPQTAGGPSEATG